MTEPSIESGLPPCPSAECATTGCDCMIGDHHSFDTPILTRAETDAMEIRVMSVGCSDQDYRRLMDSHEALRCVLARYEGRTHHV